MIYSAPIGPIFGPTGPPPDGDSAALPDPDSFPDDDFSGAPGAGGPAAAAGAAEGPASGGIRPNSPYTRERALIRDLTLPAVPTLDLPPSPAGRDPAPGLNARLERFLALKREGEHFNARLSRSSAMMNPALMDKLMAFVGLEDAAQQYVTTVGTDIFDPVNGFPEWNGREKLKEAVRILNQEIEDEKAMRGPRDAIEFVPASSSSASQRPR